MNHLIIWPIKKEFLCSFICNNKNLWSCLHPHTQHVSHLNQTLIKMIFLSKYRLLCLNGRFPRGKSVFFPDEAIWVINFFSAQVDSFLYHEWPFPRNESTCAEKKLIPRIASSRKDTFFFLLLVILFQQNKFGCFVPYNLKFASTCTWHCAYLKMVANIKSQGTMYSKLCYWTK